MQATILMILSLLLNVEVVAVNKEKLTPETKAALELAQVYYGEPIFVTSAYRSKEHNKEVGGAPNSYHLKGEAVDIRLPSTKEKTRRLLKALQDAEFRGLGLYSTHIHADRREKLTTWRGK